MIRVGIGTSANLKVVEELTEAVEKAADNKHRAVKVVVDMKTESLKCDGTLPEGASMAEDFGAIASLLDDAIPCLILLRLQGVEGDTSGPAGQEGDWAMLAWTPEDAPVKLKMGCASSRRTVREAFNTLRFKEYQTTERGEMTLDQFMEATKALTRDDRRDVMTQQERDQADVREKFQEEQKRAPKLLAGLVALQIKALDSWSDAIRQLLTDDGKAVVGRLAGDKLEDLDGQVLDGVPATGSPTALRGGKLPAEEPAYVLFRPKEGRVLLISWLPDNAKAKMKMKFSTFKASVVDLIKSAAPEHTVATVEVSEEDELTDSLKSVEPAAAKVAAMAAAASAPKAGGFRPPPGAVAMPGMGGGGGYGGVRPPVGGFALPGMGGPKPA